MVSRARVIELAEAAGLADHAGDLLPSVRPGWRLDLELDASPDRPAASKIGGDPDLTPGEGWPLNRRGIPMTFVAQIDASRLPPLDGQWPVPAPWRHGGQLVRMFADLLDNPIEPGPCVVLQCAPDAPLTRTRPPAPPNPLPPGGAWDGAPLSDRFQRLPEAAVRPTPFLSAPELHPVLKPEMWDFSEPADRSERWATSLRTADEGAPPRDPYEVHHLLGEACSIQDDVREAGAMVAADPSWGALPPEAGDPTLTTEDAWRVLLAIHFDERIRLNIHDGGAFHLIAPIADLAQGRYDRVVCDPSSG
jgi:hypothetical protein